MRVDVQIVSILVFRCVCLDTIGIDTEGIYKTIIIIMIVITLIMNI